MVTPGALSGNKIPNPMPTEDPKTKTLNGGSIVCKGWPPLLSSAPKQNATNSL